MEIKFKYEKYKIVEAVADVFSVSSKLPGDQEGLFKLAIQLRKFLFITL
jgi:hypothetical protein